MNHYDPVALTREDVAKLSAAQPQFRGAINLSHLTPTDEVVERAAAASWNLKASRPWSEIPEEWKPFYRDQMRAALVAVLG